MAGTGKGKKPRLRKVAPTVRERAETARQESSKSKQRPIRSGLAKAKKPLSKVRLPRNRVTNVIFRFFGFLKKILRKLVPSYFINSWHEVKQVTWPNRRDTWRLTAAVFVFAIVFGIAIGIVDKGLTEIFRRLILN